MGATTVIGVDTIPRALAIADALGVDHTIDFKTGDPIKAILELTDGRGVDVPSRRWARRATFEAGASRAAAGRHAVEPRRLFD